MVLPVVVLLLHAEGLRGGDEHAPTATSTSLVPPSILDEMIGLCDCYAGEEKIIWKEASKNNLLAIENLYRESCASRPPLLRAQLRTMSLCFFDLLAQSITLTVKLSFATLQHVIEEGNLRMIYDSFYHHLSTMMSLVVHIVTPLASALLARAASEADASRLLVTMKGVNSLIVACCAAPPLALHSGAVLKLMTSTSDTSPLRTVLLARPPVRSSCSSSGHVVHFRHVLVGLQDLCHMTIGIFDLHSNSIISNPTGPDFDAHFSGLVSCLQSASKIVK